MVQLAALGLCLWAMERAMAAPARRPAPELPPIPPAPERPSAPVPPPHVAAEPPAPAAPWSPSEAPAAGFRTEIGEMPPPGPRFGPPTTLTLDVAHPPTEATPAWLREDAAPTSQVLRGALDGGWVHVVFHPDRSLRLVDVDGGRYAGRVVDAAADLREADGSRTLLVRIGVADDGRLQLAFAGGPRDAETVVLDDVIEHPA